MTPKKTHTAVPKMELAGHLANLAVQYLSSSLDQPAMQINIEQNDIGYFEVYVEVEA